MGGRIFKDQELAEMGAPTHQLICAAVDANDKLKAKEFALRLHREAARMHDAYAKWTTSLLSFIGRNYGDDSLEKALRESCEVLLRDGTEALRHLDEKGDIRRKVEMLASFMRGHNSPLKIEEDDEKFTIMMQPCGSGGKMIQEGLYGPPCDYYKIKKGQPMTYGQEDFPVYCAHGAIDNMLQIEWTGAIQFYEEPSGELGVKPCNIYLYKDASKVPAELFAKLGMVKPSQPRRPVASKPAGSKSSLRVKKAKPAGRK